MSTSYWKNSTGLPQESPDITIIGGGFIGLSVAYWLLLKKPSLKVWILDSAALGEGASGRNAGFLTKGSLTFYEHLSSQWGSDRARELFEFAQESIDLTLAHLKPSEVIHTTSYSFYREAKNFEFAGFVKSASTLHQFQESYICEGEKSIHPMRLLESLEEKVSELGGVILRGVEVLDFESDQIHTGRGVIHTSQVVFALNGFSNALIPNLIKPQRAQMLCVELAADIHLPGLMYEPDARVYFKFLESKKLVIGGKRLVDPVNEQTHHLGVNPLIQQELSRYVEDNLGPINKVLARWSGIMGFSSDELPIIEKRHSYYLIAGFSGHGMGLGFNSARNLADMILENKTSFFQSLRTRCRL